MATRSSCKGCWVKLILQMSRHAKPTKVCVKPLLKATKRLWRYSLLEVLAEAMTPLRAACTEGDNKTSKMLEILEDGEKIE
jgi:hypothetical protein